MYVVEVLPHCLPSEQVSSEFSLDTSRVPFLGFYYAHVNILVWRNYLITSDKGLIQTLFKTLLLSFIGKYNILMTRGLTKELSCRHKIKRISRPCFNHPNAVSLECSRHINKNIQLVWHQMILCMKFIPPNKNNIFSSYEYSMPNQQINKSSVDCRSKIIQ